MTEVLKNSGEQVIDGAGVNRLDVLTEISDKFDANKAKQLAEADKLEKSEAPTTSTRLETLANEAEPKAVENLTPKEAAKEYLDLLLDLSANFTSAEGKSSRVATYDENGNLQVQNRGYSGQERRIVGQVYETATGKDFREEYFKDDAQNDKYIDRELTLGMADDIISAESDWRAAGESTTGEAEQEGRAALEQEKAKAKDKLDKMGKLKKAFYTNLRKKEYNRLYTLANTQPKTEAGKSAAKANARLQQALEAAYSEDYGYGHHKLNYEHTHDAGYSDKINGEYNDRFFDDARKQKIDRAIALRRKLEAEGIVKK